MTNKRISRISWRLANLAAWGERHELLTDVIIAVLLTVVFAVLFWLAMQHDAIWYDGLSTEQKIIAGGY